MVTRSERCGSTGFVNDAASCKHMKSKPLVAPGQSKENGLSIGCQLLCDMNKTPCNRNPSHAASVSSIKLRGLASGRHTRILQPWSAMKGPLNGPTRIFMPPTPKPRTPNPKNTKPRLPKTETLKASTLSSSQKGTIRETLGRNLGPFILASI